MSCWAINSHWHCPGPSFSTSNGAGVHFLEPTGQPNRWWHGPGANAVTTGEFCQAINGQWEGNPERFLRITWLTAPTQGDGHYYPEFRNTVLEHKINSGRLFAGKTVTLSWQLRAAGGAPVALVIWRHFTNHPYQLFPGPVTQLAPGEVHRLDFILDLPLVPSGYDTDLYSYLGIGVDLIGQSGPQLDFGPCRFSEGDIRYVPIAEKKYEMEKLLAMQSYP